MKSNNKIFAKENSKYWNNIFFYLFKNFQFSLVILSIFLSFLIVFIFWFNSVNYVALYDHLSDKDEHWVISQLQAMKIPYKFNNSSSVLSVPENKIHELRFQLLNNNLNKEKIYGFDFLDNNKFSLSQFNEKLNYHRGLEGELSKTLMNIFPIKYARVHLSYQKDTNFLPEKEIPSAAVVVSLYPNTTLKKNQVNAIISLITGSISNLSSDHVVIIDQNGDLLNPLSLSNKRFFNNDIDERIDFLKDYYHNCINAVLQPLLGSNNFVLQITPHILSYTTKKKIKHYNKKKHKVSPKLLSLVPEYLNSLGITKKNVFLKNLSENRILKNIKNIQLSQDKRRTQSKFKKGILSIKDFNTGKKVLEFKKNNMTVNRKNYIKINKIVKSNLNTYKRVFNNQFIYFSVRILVNYKINHLGSFVPLTTKEIKNVKLLAKTAINFSKEYGDVIDVINVLFFQSKNDFHINVLLKYTKWISDYKFYLFFLFLFIFFFFVLRKVIFLYIKKNNAFKKISLEKEKNITKTCNLKDVTSTDSKNKSILLNSKNIFNNKNKMDVDPKIIAKVIQVWMKNKK